MDTKNLKLSKAVSFTENSPVASKSPKIHSFAKALDIQNTDESKKGSKALEEFEIDRFYSKRSMFDPNHTNKRETRTFKTKIGSSKHWRTVKLLVIMLMFYRALYRTTKQEGAKVLETTQIDKIRSTRAKTVRKKTQKPKNKKDYVFDTKSSIFKVWDYFITLVMLYIVTVMPFRIAFTTTYLRYSDGLFPLDMVIEVAFLVEIIVNFFTPYYDSDRNLITSNSKIAWKYLTGWFVIDFVCVLPFYILEWDDSTDVNFSQSLNFSTLLLSPRLLRMLKLFRVVKMYNRIQKQGEGHFTKKKNVIISKFVSFGLVLYYFGHLFACLWFYLASLQGFAPETWVMRERLLDKPLIEQYFASLYFSFVSLLTVGYGDITAYTNEEISLVCVWMVFSAFYYSFNLSNISSSFVDLNKDSFEVTNKINAAIEISKAAQFSRGTERRIKSEFVKQEVKIITNSLEDVRGLLSEVPFNVKKKILANVFMGSYLKIGLFNKFGVEVLIDVVPLLKEAFYGSNNIIYKKDDVAQSRRTLISLFPYFWDG